MSRDYATTLEEVRLGSCSIAVPVFHTGRIGASIGLVLPTNQAATMTRHLPVLKGISAQIERATARIPLETLLGSHVRDAGLTGPLRRRPQSNWFPLSGSHPCHARVMGDTLVSKNPRRALALPADRKPQEPRCHRRQKRPAAVPSATAPKPPPGTTATSRSR